MRKLSLILAIAAVQAAAGRQDLRQASLGDRIDSLARNLKGARVGISVCSAEDGRDIYALRQTETFQLASNTKLFTTAAALDRLGPDFRFRTILGTAGGDLHVFGGGDPCIGARFNDGDPTALFSRWAAALKAEGLHRVGKVILHTGIFDGERTCPGWKTYDPWPWWAAPFGPLSLNDNCVDLRIEPGPEGQPCRIRLSPETSYVKIVNRTKTSARPALPFGYWRPAGSNTITLRGEVALGSRPATYWASVHDPTMYFGTVLKETLEREGIATAGPIEETAAPAEEVEGFREIAAHESDLAAALEVCNRSSQNFYAEMILRVLAWKTRGFGTRRNGLEAVRESLEAAGIRSEGMNLEDGSGLTRGNTATPRDVARLLLHMRRHKHAKVFIESLPCPGMAGSTLRNRMKSGDLKDRIRAKTGHVSGVSALSGYAESASGETYVFSILVNATEGGSAAGADRLQDRICELLARHKGD